MVLSERQKRALIAKGLGSISSDERKLIDFYELLWYTRHQVPSVEDCAKYLKFSQSKINFFLTRRPVQKALDQRGIPWAQHTQIELTSTQIACAITVMNFADTRSMDEKLDALGVNPNQYYAWLRDPTFKNFVDNLADTNLKNIRPTAVAEYTKAIQRGEWNAVKHFLDVTGELQSDMPQSEHLIRMLIEIIQRHVKDPEVILAIAKDMKLVTANRTLEVAAGVTSPASDVIDSEFISEEETRENLKVLGY